MGASITENKVYSMGSQEVTVSDLEEQEKIGSLERVESAHSRVLDDLGRGEGVSFKDLPIIDVKPEDNRRVLRKLDNLLLPLTMIAYTLQYIDRSAMSYAAVFFFSHRSRPRGDPIFLVGKLFLPWLPVL